MEKAPAHETKGRAGQPMAKRGRPISNDNVKRITNRHHLLAALAEGVDSGDLRYIHNAIDYVKVIRDPIERGVDAGSVP